MTGWLTISADLLGNDAPTVRRPSASTAFNQGAEKMLKKKINSVILLIYKIAQLFSNH
jgi:hypothetical protein